MKCNHAWRHGKEFLTSVFPPARGNKLLRRPQFAEEFFRRLDQGELKTIAERESDRE